MDTNSTHNTLLTTIVVLLVVIAIILLAGRGGRMISSAPYGAYSYYGASAIGPFAGQQPVYYYPQDYQAVTAYSRPSRPTDFGTTSSQREVISTSYQYLDNTPQYTYSCDGTYCWTNQ